MFHTPAFAGVFGFCSGALANIRAHAYDLERVFGFRPGALTDIRAHAYDSTACLILQQSGRRRKSGWLLERRSVYSLGGPARTPPPSKAKALLYP